MPDMSGHDAPERDDLHTVSLAELEARVAADRVLISRRQLMRHCESGTFDARKLPALNNQKHWFVAPASIEKGIADITVSGNTTLSHSTTTSLFVNTSLTASSAAFGGTATSSFSTAGALTLASALNVSSGGTGWAAIQSGAIPYGNGSSALATTSAGTNGYGLADVLKLKPVSFTYKPELKVPGNQVGFIAEDVVEVVPEVVGFDAEGRPTNVDYGKFTPILVNAIQEIASFTGTFREALIAWLADSANGIVDLFAKNLHAENVFADRGTFGTLTASSTLTSELCVDDVCVTRDQFKAMVEGFGSGSVLGATSQEDEEAAGAPSVGDTEEAPAASPASSAIDAGTSTPAAQADEDTASTTTSAPVDPGGSNAPAANDNQPDEAAAAEAPQQSEVPVTEERASAPAEPEPAAAPAVVDAPSAANDNAPPSEATQPLPATGTE